MTDASNRDEWLSQIKGKIQEGLGAAWRESRWTEFVEEVVWRLHDEDSIDAEDTIEAAAGLVNCGVKTKEGLIYLAGNPPDDEKLSRKLEAKGVSLVICAMLFNEYVSVGQTDESLQRMTHSVALKEFFFAHRETCKSHKQDGKGCVLCHGIFYSGDGNKLSDPISDDFINYFDKKCEEERKNYLQLKVPLGDLNLEMETQKSPKTIVSGNSSENMADRYRMFCSSLLVDVNSEVRHLVKGQCEGYFDGFYINLLRQCLEANMIACFQREKILQESRTAERKADLIASIDNHTILTLKSAMNGDGDKISRDRGKLAMEIYRVWATSPLNAPPIGILVSSGTDSTTCIFEVYTMIQIESESCLVTLDVFPAPMCKSTIGTDPAQVSTQCALHARHPNSESLQSETKLFEDACIRIQRIVEACLLLKASYEGTVRNAKRQKVVSDSTNTPADASGNNNDGQVPRTPGGRHFQRGSTNTKTPTNIKNSSKNNCRCANYEFDDKKFVVQTGWSEVGWAIHRCSRRRFVRKSERLDWKEYDEIGWNPFDTEVSVFMKIAAMPSCATLVKPVDICITDRIIFLEELDEVDWRSLQSNPSHTLAACMDILQAVATLHELNIAHCDIKDSAVMVRRGDKGAERFVLCDFNLAIVNADEFDPSRVPFGTDGWSWKSQRMDQAHANCHDLFSLGLLLAWMCCRAAMEMVKDHENVSWYDTFTSLTKEAHANNDKIRHAILNVAFSLCRVELSISDAIQNLRLKAMNLKDEAKTAKKVASATMKGRLQVVSQNVPRSRNGHL